LISNELLGGSIRPESLLGLFCRPSHESGYSDYLEAIPVPDGFQDADTRLSEVGEVAPSLAEGLLQALYGSTDPHTVLAVPRYSFADAPMLLIWRFQWQSLRQRFTFCGGARGPRSLEGEPFILQAALERDLRRLDRGPISPKMVPWTTREGIAADEWVHEAVVACANPASNDLRVFIEHVGRELPGETALFRPVVQAYLILNLSADSSAVARLIAFAAKEYPTAETGREYKRFFLRAGNPAGLSEPAILQGLATVERWQAFDADELELRLRAAALWHSGDEAWRLLSLLLSDIRNPLAEEIILGLSAKMPVRFLRQAPDTTTAVIAGVICRNPALACSAEFWDTPPEIQSRASAALMTCRDAVASWSNEIIRVALDASADPIPTLVDVFGSPSVSTVMEWLEADEKRMHRLPAGWRAALANRQVAMIEWLNSRSSVRPETTYFALGTTGNTETMMSNPLAVSAFLKHVPAEDSAPDGILIPLAARLLRVALATNAHGAIDLASACLDIVYHAAANSKIPDNVWQELSSLLPDGYWWTWDRCFRLRTGIAEKFTSEQWPAARLNDVTRDDAIFGEIVSELKERRSGRRILAHAASATESNARREVMLND
jgi:hypothetical protein